MQFLAEAGKQFRQDPQAANQNRMEMIALWRGFMHRREWFDMVALENCHSLEIVGQHTRADQTGNTAADHHRMLAEPTRHNSPPQKKLLPTLPSATVDGCERIYLRVCYHLIIMIT